MTISTDVLQSVTPALVRLLEIDALAITGSAYYFCDTGSFAWGGNNYLPFPFGLEGISNTSAGAPTRPRLLFSNVDGFIKFIANNYLDLVGAKVVYRETLATYASTTISFPPHYYTISQRLQSPDRSSIIFEIKSALDMDKKSLPARQMLRDGMLGFPGLGVNKQTR